MKLVSVSMEGFRSFRKRQTVDLSEVLMATITGPNHSGKTSVLKAIEYALFGPAHGEAKSLVNHGSAMMRVELVMMVGAQKVTIIRTHKADGTGHKLTVITDDTDVARDLATSQACINEMLGMDRDVARVTWMSMQGDIEALASMDGPSRRGVFVKAFGLNEYETLVARAKEARRVLTRSTDELHGKLELLSEPVVLNADLATFSDDDLADEITRHDEAEQLSRQVSKVETLREQLEADHTSLDELGTAETWTDQDSQLMEMARHGVDVTLEVKSLAQQHLSDAQGELRAATKAIGDVTDELRIVDERKVGECGYCGQALTAEALAHIHSSLDAKLSNLTVQVLKMAEASVGAAEAELSTAVTHLAERNRELQALTDKMSHYQRVTGQRGVISERISRLAVKLAEAEADLSTLVHARPSTSRDDVVLEVLTRAREAKRVSDLSQVTTRLDDAMRRLGELDILVAAWSPSGIPMTVLAGAAGEVESDANRILSMMESDLQVSIDASGASVDILVDSGPWSKLSGQERFFTAMALRLALGSTVARRTGHKVETMLMDEGWGALDAEHAHNAVAALSNLSDEVSILTVTHIDEVASQIPQRINVAASPGGSLVSRVN